MELILAALTAGAAAGSTETVATAIKDAYGALKNKVGSYFTPTSPAAEALDLLEKEPERAGEIVRGALLGTTAASDGELVASARRLLDLTEGESVVGKYDVRIRGSQGIQVGDRNTQHNTF
ncbi:hypothetical protein [Pseudonocardia parietis]|uniref:RHIM domain-containing protein n=1 Tax=Pseudonocardia parietis TaxID=570936 RepID=A0ABS4VRW2_9PSEU|nr:hypothetical protein [Pseudonocardia parietis]MBP2366672.1 hypothetical protein [Pseudonocardia parietis]